MIIEIERCGGFWVFIIQMLLHYFNYRFFRNVPGIYMKTIFGILKIIVTPLILAFNLFCNTLALILNRFDIEDSFTINYSVIAKKSF